MDFKTKPREKIIFAKHFRNSNQQLCKNIGKTQLKNTRQQQDKQKQKFVFPEKLLQKPNLRRRDFLPSTLGSENPTNMQKHWQKKTLKNTRAQQDNKNQKSLPKMDFKNKPRKKIIFAKHFREKTTKTNKYAKT